MQWIRISSIFLRGSVAGRGTFRSHHQLALALALALFVQPADIRYSPGTSQYEQTLVTSGGSMGGGSGAMELESRIVFTAAFSAVGRDSLLLDLTVDSSSTSLRGSDRSLNDVAPEGTKLQRKMSVYGKSAPATAGVRNATELATTIFPVIARGARLGTAWEDTLPLTGIGGANIGTMVSGRIVRSSVVSRDTTYEGQPAWKIVTGSTVEVRGSPRGNAPVTVEGGGSGNGVFFISKSGVLLHSRENQSVNLNITAQGGFSLPLETGVVRTVNRKKDR